MYLRSQSVDGIWGLLPGCVFLRCFPFLPEMFPTHREMRIWDLHPSQDASCNEWIHQCSTSIPTPSVSIMGLGAGGSSCLQHTLWLNPKTFLSSFIGHTQVLAVKDQSPPVPDPAAPRLHHPLCCFLAVCRRGKFSCRLFLHSEERFCILTHLETTNSERTRKGLDEKLVVFIQRQNSACLKQFFAFSLFFLYFQDALSLPLLL